MWAQPKDPEVSSDQVFLPLRNAPPPQYNLENNSVLKFLPEIQPLIRGASEVEK